MTDKSILPEDLEKNLNYFCKIKESALGEFKNRSNLRNLYSNLKKDLEQALENEKKAEKLLHETREICKEQMETISLLNNLKEINENIKTDNLAKEKQIKELEEKVKSLKFDFDIQLQNQTALHLRELDRIKNENDQKIRDLKDELDLVFNSSELHRTKLESEIKTIKGKHNEELKEMYNKNSRMQTSLAFCQKKMFDLEEKIRTLEIEKKTYYTSKTNFAPATSVQKNQFKKPNLKSKFYNTNDDFNEDFDLNETVKRVVDSKPSPQRYENVKNVHFENENPKDEFLKPTDIRPLYSDSDTETDNEKSNASKFYDNIVRGETSTKQGRQNNNGKNRNGSQLGLMPLPVTTTKQVKSQFPASRKRKLYDPNNWDYLE